MEDQENNCNNCQSIVAEYRKGVGFEQYFCNKCFDRYKCNICDNRGSYFKYPLIFKEIKYCGEKCWSKIVEGFSDGEIIALEIAQLRQSLDKLTEVISNNIHIRTY